MSKIAGSRRLGQGPGVEVTWLTDKTTAGGVAEDVTIPTPADPNVRGEDIFADGYLTGGG